jgi:hypothetical protein
VADLARLAGKQGAWVSVPFMQRYSFWAVAVKHMIQTGEFGRLAHLFPGSASDVTAPCRVGLALDGR